MRKYLLAAALVAAYVTPVLADTFYVVMDSSTKACTVTNKKPKGKMTQMGKTTFKSKEDASDAMKSMTECK